MATLIFMPGDIVRQNFYSRKDLVFLDNDGWWFFDGSSQKRSFLDVFSVDIKCGSADVVRIIEKLRSWGPIWARWVAQADQYELLYREALDYILHIVAGLEHLDIDSVIFHTSISHHLDSSFVEIACSEANIPMVFLYYNVICNRLVPYLQNHSISDRKPLGMSISEYSASGDIKSFIQNKMGEGKPAHNRLIKERELSASRAILLVSYWSIRRFVLVALRRQRGRQFKFFERFPVLGLSEHLRLIGCQKAALNYYNRHLVKLNQLRVGKLIGDHRPVLLLAAHFQPEATSFPEGGDLNNHSDIVYAIRNMGYSDPIIYKEHGATYTFTDPITGATRVGGFRSTSYFKQLSKLGCVFVDPSMELSLDESLNYWYLPITITGTIAVERSLVGFATIYTGHPWYKGMPGCVHLSEMMKFIENGTNVTIKSKEVEDEAFYFIDDLLSKKSMINVPGIGSGIRLKNKDDLKIFNREFNTLLDKMMNIRML